MITGIVLIAVAIVVLFFVFNNRSKNETSDSVDAFSSSVPVIEQSRYDFFLEKYNKAEKKVIESADREIRNVQTQIEATSDPTKKMFLQSFVDYFKYDKLSRLLNYSKYFPKTLSGDEIDKARKQYKEIAKNVYNYHNLGVNNFNGKEKTPYGSGERYNFDRMSMLVTNFDFYNKNVIDIGCNSGWFIFQIAMLGANKVVGVDYEMQGIMGESIRYAKAFSNYLQADVNIVDQNLEVTELEWLAYNHNINSFDAAIVFSVLHHIENKRRLMENIFKNTKEVIFYEDHEFWNELYDDDNNLIEVQGSGYKFDWNKDLSWREKISSLKKHEPLILNSFMNSWRKETLLLDRYSKIKLLGFSEKRRPLLAFYK